MGKNKKSVDLTDKEFNSGKNEETKTSDVLVEEAITSIDSSDENVQIVSEQAITDKSEEKIKKIENDEKNNTIQNVEKINLPEEEKTEIIDKKENVTEIEGNSNDSNSKLTPKFDDSIKKHTEKKSHKTLFGVSIAFIVILIIALLFSTVFALATSNSYTIIKGVSIKDIDVSGLTREQALEKLTAAFNNKVSKKITLKHNEFELEVVPSQFDVSFDLDSAIDMAYNKGRTRKYI